MDALTTHRPPAHLRASTKRWFKSVLTDYELDAHHVHLLGLACNALDQAAEAREKLAAGSAYEDRFGQPKESPWVMIEHRARNDFRVLCRELGLDVDTTETPRMAVPSRPGPRGSHVLESPSTSTGAVVP